MYLNFETTNIGIEFDPANCYELTGFTEHELIALTGVFGYTRYFNVVCFEGIYPNLRVAIECPALTVSIEIQIGEGLIQNELIRCNDPGKGIGFKVFCAQVDAAVQAGFAQIRCFAVGSYEMFEKWNGYVTWGKFGFVIDNYFQNDFNALLKAFDRKETTLNQLLATKEGEKFWKENGKSWPGKFDLYKGSQSLILLEKYKQKKKLL